MRRPYTPALCSTLTFMQRTFAGPPRTVLVGVLIVCSLVAVGVGIQERIVVRDSIASGNLGPVTDFDRWMIMTPRFLHDRADYIDDNLPTAPLTLLVFAPF